MKKTLFRAVLAASLTVMFAAVPTTFALDQRADRSATDGASLDVPGDGPVDLQFDDRPRDGRREKPRPKQLDPGRQNMNGLEALCLDNGFLADLFGGFTGIVFTCPPESDSQLRRAR